jgi:arylsulfatase A-like enzyme
VAVAVLALFCAIAYPLNTRVLPDFLSIPSLAANTALVIAAAALWWELVRRLEPHRSRLIGYAANGTVTCAIALLLAVLLGGAVLAARAWSPEAVAGRPNVLIVLIDTLRPDRLGAYGYHRNTSPHIDRIAAEGWVFSRAVAQASWTKPSIASMFTGLYASQTSVDPGTWAHEGDRGVVVQALAAEHVTLAERLAAAGYETAAFGSNHHLLPELGFSQGFLTYDWETATAIRSARVRQFLQRFIRTGFAAEWINDHFLQWLDRHGDAERPFFAYLHHIDVHWPFLAPPPYAGMYAEVEPAVDFNDPAFWTPTIERLNRGEGPPVDERTMRAMNDAYDEGIHYVDAGLGTIFDELRRRGLYDDTLILITSDHGEEFLEHGSLGHGHTLYDELILVPLIVKFPCPGPHCARRVVESQVELVDIFPTVVHEAGLSPDAHLVGRHLSEAAADERYAYSEHSERVAVRDRAWKWIYSAREDSGELYHLTRDPGESRNLAAAAPDLVSELTIQALDFSATHRRVVAADDFIRADQRMLENLRALGYVR